MKLRRAGHRGMEIEFSNHPGSFINTVAQLTRGGYTLLINIRRGPDGRTLQRIRMGLLDLPRSLSDTRQRQLNKCLEKAAQKFVSKVLDVRRNA